MSPSRASCRLISLPCPPTRRNEAPYLREWIEYHRLIGFDAFLLLDDGSTDDTPCILQAYAKVGIVIRVPTDIGYNDTKLDKMNDHVFDTCANYLNSHQDRFDPRNTWMMTHDVDEFVWLKHGTSTISRAIRNILRNKPYVRSIEVPRLLFGSADKQHFEPGLVIDRFQRRFDRGSCGEKHRRDQARRLFDQDNPRSYCERKNKNSYDNVKSISLVSSLATKCDENNIPKHREKAHGANTKEANYCSSTHQHMLVSVPKKTPHVGGSTDAADLPMWNKNARKSDQRIAAMQYTSHFMVVMHYMVKSRQEFFHRACTSVWSHKYFQCEGCNPESYFDITGT